jgi:hypothetical protein
VAVADRSESSADFNVFKSDFIAEAISDLAEFKSVFHTTLARIEFNSEVNEANSDFDATDALRDSRSDFVERVAANESNSDLGAYFTPIFSSSPETCDWKFANSLFPMQFEEINSNSAFVAEVDFKVTTADSSSD